MIFGIQKNLASGLALLLLISTLNPTTAQNISIEQSLGIDHVSFMVDDKNEFVNVFKAAGFTFGDTLSITNQEGQGSSSTSLLFFNTYLEFGWINDSSLVSKSMKLMGLDLEKAIKNRKKGLKNFQIGLHLNDGYKKDDIPFATSPYSSEWLSQGEALLMAKTNNEGNQPDVFVVPTWLKFPEKRLAETYENGLEPYVSRLNHPNGAQRLTSLEILLPVEEPTTTLQTLEAMGIVKLTSGDQLYAILTFDNHSQDKQVDMRPQFPFVIRY